MRVKKVMHGKSLFEGNRRISALLMIRGYLFDMAFFYSMKSEMDPYTCAPVLFS